MTEYRLVSFTQPSDAVFHPEVGSVKVLTVGFNDSLPQLAEMMDGWEPVSYQLVPQGDITYLTILLKTEVSVPGLDRDESV